MRGYFAIGVERISKPGNAGSLARSANAFGASFFFAIDPEPELREMRLVDTSDGAQHLPVYFYDSVAALTLPRGCALVGVELTDDAIDLPSFRHPLRAAYVLGPERGSLSAPLVERCDFVIKIPTRFCVNVGVAGAVVMYDRMISLGRFAERPVRAGGPVAPRPAHVYGRQIFRDPETRRRAWGQQPVSPGGGPDIPDPLKAPDPEPHAPESHAPESHAPESHALESHERVEQPADRPGEPQ
jgi:tRNA(Leu) C34 or U34 (ribose-2'-O)-methylase TrmL